MFAGIMKIAQIDQLVTGIVKYRILPDFLARALGITLPYVEVFLGAALILGIRRKTPVHYEWNIDSDLHHCQGQCYRSRSRH